MKRKLLLAMILCFTLGSLVAGIVCHSFDQALGSTAQPRPRILKAIVYNKNDDTYHLIEGGVSVDQPKSGPALFTLDGEVMLSEIETVSHLAQGKGYIDVIRAVEWTGENWDLIRVKAAPGSEGALCGILGSVRMYRVDSLGGHPSYVIVFSNLRYPVD